MMQRPLVCPQSVHSTSMKSGVTVDTCLEGVLLQDIGALIGDVVGWTVYGPCGYVEKLLGGVWKREYAISRLV